MTGVWSQSRRLTATKEPTSKSAVWSSTSWTALFSTPTKWPSYDLLNKNKKRPFNADATLNIQPEKNNLIIFAIYCKFGY